MFGALSIIHDMNSHFLSPKTITFDPDIQYVEIFTVYQKLNKETPINARKSHERQ